METIVIPPRSPQCTVCGAPLPPGAPQGLCPRCLLAGAAAPTDPAIANASRPEAPSVEQVSAAFPQLEILGLIGVGGMGAVFKARQKNLDRLVALKVLPESLAAEPGFAERFNREARALARLNHPNIVTVHDYGHAGGFFFLLMEFVDGVNLRQAMRAGKFTSKQALTLVPKICEALQFAHEQGVLHRDIKPENILLDGTGRVKIADFGIAKLIGEEHADASLTLSGAHLGTPAYMAPEQIEKPGDVDHRADIYSLGVVFYELLTGELPLGRFGPPSSKTDLDARVDEIVMRALAKERELRQQSANEMRTQVETVSATPGARVTAPSTAPIAPGAFLVGYVFSGLVMLAGVVLAFFALRHSADSAAFWGAMGGVIGCIVGGGGGLIGTWNSHRQARGLGNLTEEPGWNLLDHAAAALAVVGELFLIKSLMTPAASASARPSTLIGALLLGQGLLFLALRHQRRSSATGPVPAALLKRPSVRWLLAALALALVVGFVAGNRPAADKPSLQATAGTEPGDAVDAANRRLAEQKKRFESGQLASYLELARAERDLALAKADGEPLATAQANHKFAVIELTAIRQQADLGKRDPAAEAEALQRLEAAQRALDGALARKSGAKGVAPTGPAISITVVSVDLREDPKGFWLGLDLVQRVTGRCQISVRNEGDENAQTRKTTYFKEMPGQAPIEHFRIEWLLPAAMAKADRLALHDRVSKARLLRQVTLRPGDEEEMFAVTTAEHGPLAGYLGVIASDPPAHAVQP